MRKSRFVCMAFLVALLVATNLFGQTETGQIVGTVTDQSGAVVPQAKVTIRNVGIGAEPTTETDDNGNYAVTSLLPAVYEVTVEKQGFAKTTMRAQVTVGSRVSLDLTLAVGEAIQTVEVTAEAGVAINTETQTLSQVVNTKQILELPTLTRNPYDLVGTSGNVSSAADAGLTPRGAGFNINGLRSAGTNVLLDGAANNDEFVASVGQQIPLDAVQEFSVLTNNFTAEYGRVSAGVVNVVTKSGTNALHGTGYWFGRYSKLAANTFDNNANGIPRPVFTRNQFGYSVGGPVIKDKLFFFQSTEWIRVRSSSIQVVAIPHPDLIAASGAATKSFFSTFGKLRSNFVPLQTFTKAQLGNPCPATGTCASLPGATNFFTKGQYSVPSNSGGGDPQNTYEIVGRGDWTISDKTQLYGRYAFLKADRFAGSNVNSPYQGFDAGSSDKDSNFLISVTHTFSPRLSSQSKLVFNRLNNQQPLGANPVSPTLFLKGGTPARIQSQLVALPGYSPFTPGNAIPFGGPQNFVQAYEDFTYTKGRHNLRFGGNYVYIRDNRAFGAYEEAVETLSITSTATGIENLLNGVIDQFQAAVDPQGKFPCGATVTPQCSVSLPVSPPDFSRSNRYHEFGVYGQDSFRIRPRVTLNLGLRWEYFGVQHNKDPRKDSNYFDALGGSIFQNIRNGDVAITPNSPVRGLWRKEWDAFSPRVGFAWDVFGNGKTSFRGGYGISYERNFGNVTFNVIQNVPNYAVISIISNQDVPSFLPVTTNNSGPLAGTTPPSKALPVVSLRNVDSNIRLAYAHFWSVSVEREALKNLFVGVDYSGSKGVRLYTLENPNRIGAGNVFLGDPCTPGPSNVSRPSTRIGNCTVRLRTTQFTNINRRGNNGASLYNALNVRVDVRNIGNSGLNLRTNYTYAHAFDNLSSTFSESDNNINLGLLDPFNPRLDRGSADFDVRHRWVLSGTWDIPFARSVTSPLRKRVFDGWTVAPIVTVRSGFPFTLYDCTLARAICPRGVVSARPDRRGVDNVPDTSTVNTFQYINIGGIPFITGLSGSSGAPGTTTVGFVNPIINVSDFGPFPANMLPRNFFRGPGAWNLDVGVYKTTKITERFSLQYRAEFFNAFNHSNLYVTLGDNDINGLGFVSAKKGVRPVGLDERRNIQMALKLIF